MLLTHVNVSPQKPFPGSPPNFLVLNGRGYFVGDNGTTGPQLWTTDGTASGTVMVANLGPSGTTAPPLLYGAFGSLVIFSKVDASGTAQLYATDGTSAGTAALTSLTGQNSFVSREFLIAGSKFYFATGAVSQAAQIWASDGTPGGTHLVTNPSNYFGALNNPQFFTPVGTRFLYVSQDLLWSVDTTSDTISAVTASGGVDGFGPPMYVSNLVAENGYALFLAGGMNGLLIDQELWSSDGTSAGTYRVAVINPGPQLYSLFQKVGAPVGAAG